VRLGKESRRKRLRTFRYKLVDALIQAEFNVRKDAIEVFYEGRFMRINAEFSGSEKMAYLKPHISIECFVGELALEPKRKQITSLIKIILGDTCHHILFPVNCVAVDETAAEKWVALTRRLAGTKIKQRPSDKQLARHIYDLHHLNKKKLLTGQYRMLVGAIMKNDGVLFAKQNPAYAKNPLHTSELALDLLYQDRKWQENWDIFLEQMVYEKNKPTFNQALEQLRLLSKEIFAQYKMD